ncbi:hypothetical protein FRC08_003873, partial [Ceratobasidium sp. 394]
AYGKASTVVLYGDMGALNGDVRLGNSIAKRDGSMVAIDFAHARLRDLEEDDLAWKRAKWSQDEEGCIGYITQGRCQRPCIPTRKMP